MKFTKYLVGLAASAGLLFGCQELEKVQICAPSEVIPPVLAEIEDLTITAENQTEEVTFTWDAADFGAKVAVDYALEASYGDSDVYEIVSGLTGTSYKISYEILNQNLYNGLSLPADTPTPVKFYISARLGEGQKYFSLPVEATVTVTAAEKVYPMVYVIGSFNGWADGTTQELFDFAGTDMKYTGIVGFGGKASGGFKVRGSERGWDNALGNWGLDGEEETPAPESATIELKNDGGSADIKIYSKNFYNMTLDRTVPSLTMNFSFNSIGVIGTAVGGWDSDIDFKFNTETQKFYLDATLVAGELKFRADDDWTLNWGVATPGEETSKGILNGSENITVPAGNYRIYLNFNNPEELTFELNANDYGSSEPVVPEEPEQPEVPALEGWGVVGEFTEWAEGKDIMMTEVADFLVAKGVAIEAGKQFKLRKDGKWDENRGAEGDVEPFEVTLGSAFKVVANGKNMTVPTTGEYDIYFDEAKDELYVLVAGSAVPGTDLVASEWGIVGDINGWNAPDITMYKTETEGMFAAFNVNFKADGGFKVRANGVWDDSANYGLEKAGTVEAGKSYDLICGGGSQNMSIKAGIYDIWFDLTNSKIYILEPGKNPSDAEGGEVVVPDPVEQQWHIVGAFNNWNPGDAAYKMTAEGDWFVFKNFTTASDTELKFAPGAWNGDKGGNGDAFALDTEFATGGANIAVPAGSYNVYLKKDLSVYKFTAAGGSAFEPEASVWGIVGAVNNWTAPDVTMYTTETADLFVAENVSMPAGDFKIRANGVWDDSANYGLESQGSVEVDRVYDLICGGGSRNMTIAAGTYDIYFDLANSKIYVMTPGKDISEAQQTKEEVIKITYKNPAGWTNVNIYGWGDINFGDWPGKAMKKEGDVWVYELPKSNIGKSVSLIFNNGSGAQTVDLGPFVLSGDMTFDNSNAPIK